jgi:hypothetical protein
LSPDDGAPVQLASGETIVAPPEEPSPWRAAAEAGVSLGQGSKNVGLATAGFFTRLGRRIAGPF